MIPLRDANPTRRTPVITFSLIGACVAVFALELSITATGGDAALERFFEQWGAVPADITRALESGNYLGQAMLGMVTSMFLHGGWLHLLGNMLFLWIFGNNVEDSMGPVKFLAFYLLGGIAATALQTAVNADSDVANLGASGAVAAVLGGYLLLFPRARVVTVIFIIFFFTIVELPAMFFLVIWFAQQALFGALDLNGSGGGVAYFAHIGGFAFGLLAVKLFASELRRRQQIERVGGLT